MSETPGSGAATPSNSRFTPQNSTAEDLLKQQIVGLVNLSEFRKRRAEAIEQTERSSRDGTPSASGATTPDARESGTTNAAAAVFKKRKKVVKKGGLSFGTYEADDDSSTNESTNASLTKASGAKGAGNDLQEVKVKKSLRPNSTVAFQPKVMTKATLLREAQLKEQLRKEYIALQEAVKATEFCLPFVFFGGKNTPGGLCRMKKGDFVWLFLERARKVGAGTGDGSRHDWARIGVDDLLVVKGDIIIPHHYDFHYFVVNRPEGYDGKPIFSYSAEATSATPANMLPETTQPPPKSASLTPDSDHADREQASTPKYLMTASDRRAAAAAAPPVIPSNQLEGFDDDPTLTKVVDRRWYEKNKHIYPASVWEEFDPNKDYPNSSRTDGHGNVFFFSKA